MPLKLPRLLLALIIVVAAALLLVFMLFATQLSLDVWQRMQAMPGPVFYVYVSGIGLFITASVWVVYRVLRPAKPAQPVPKGLPSEADIRKAVTAAEDRGLDIQPFHDELDALLKRRDSGRIYVALFGEVSTGKSSIIKAMLPDASVDISIKAGETQKITHYTWKSHAGDELVLTDLPGRNEAGGALETQIDAEARRAQMVIYVADSDLNRDQYRDISSLLNYNKPLILCINKSDRLSPSDRERLGTRITRRLNSQAQITLVFIQSGGEQEVVRISPEGEEQTLTRQRPAQVQALATAIQDQIDQHAEELNQLRDASVFVLIQQQLDEATLAHRLIEGEKIIASSTRKAVIGALAAIAPGSDLVIQGIIGSAMVKALCKLYDTPAKQLDIDEFFSLSQGQVKKSSALILAISGNALKAFPGLGTVAGGLTHAVAYGLIFDALGHAIHTTLRQRGRLKPAPAALRFSENLNLNAREKVADIARLVWDQSTHKSP